MKSKMTKNDAIKWLGNLTQDIGQMRHQDLWDYAQAIAEISQMIDEMPDIVRCKDCIWHSEKDNGDLFCEIKSENWGEPFVVKPEHYCSSGERRD